jgi:osmotically-inducible protein OsmY
MAETTELQDTQISSAVVRELGWLPNVDSTNIKVSVTDSVVALTGTVGSYLEKVLAGKAAQRVHGVIGLAQEIDVHTRWTALTDVDIARECGEALQRAVDVPVSVKVAVTKGTVALSGEVQWQFQREAAVRTVQCLKGVTEIENDITLRSSVVLVDLQAAIEAALVRNAQLESHNISVSTLTGGGITLTGKVGSWAESRQAEHACWAAPGVTAVHNQLTLQY